MQPGVGSEPHPLKLKLKHSLKSVLNELETYTFDECRAWMMSLCVKDSAYRAAQSFPPVLILELPSFELGLHVMS